jgi:hypothetical protein
LESDAPPGGPPRFKLTTLSSVIAISSVSGASTGSPEQEPLPSPASMSNEPPKLTLPAADGGYRLVSASPSVSLSAHLGERVRVTGSYVVLVPHSSYDTGVAALESDRQGDTTIGTFTVTSIRTVAANCR